MKARRLVLLVVVALIAMLCTATSAAADPPKTDFHVLWGGFLDYQNCGSDLRVTGNAAHTGCEYYKVEILDATSGQPYGILEFWFEHVNYAVYVPEWDWWLHQNFQGKLRIQPYEVDGYWEGNLASVGNDASSDWYEPISKGELRGYGALSGSLMKTTHWFEPSDPANLMWGDFWPANVGVIIDTGKK